jgi:hypothetical protein
MQGDDTDEDGNAALRGCRNYLVFPDESGIHGANCYGFGTLWMPHERRGSFAAVIADLRLRHRYRYE